MQARLAAAALLGAFVLLVVACAGRAPVPRQPVVNETMPKDFTLTNDRPKDDAKIEKFRDPAKEKPDFVWTLPELRKEYSGNGSEYRTRHGGQIVELTGKVWSFAPYGYYAPKDAIVLNLESSPGPTICHVVDREPWGRVVPGEQVTVRGRIPLHEENVVAPLVQTVIVEPKQSSALQLTGEQLVRDARAEPKKHFKQNLLVSGTVVSKNKAGAVILELSGDDQTKIRCQVPHDLGFTIDSLQVGQKIKVSGQYVTLMPPYGVILDKALPITRTTE